MNDDERQFEDFVSNIKFDDTPDPDHRDKLEHDLLAAIAKQPRQIKFWRIIMKNKITKLATASVVSVIVLGGVTFWPSGSSGNGKWWQGPPAAWGQEIMVELEKVAALTYRQRALRVMDYGPDTMGGLWERRYAAKDKYRSEVRDEANNITHIQWTVPQGEGFAKYQVWPEHQCYTQEPEKTPPFYDDVMGLLRRYVSFLDMTERILGKETFEGHECVGFEIGPGMYGGFLVEVPTHIWFDVETKMPVRVERRGLTVNYDPTRKLTLIHDQFVYHAEVPTDMFTVQIPEGFVNAHPDEIAAKKGQMVYADVPAKLRDEIVSALKQVETAIYQKHSEITLNGDLTVYPADKIYMSRNSWRKDSYHWRDELHKIEWYVIERKYREQTDFDLNDKNFRLIRTAVNFENSTYSVANYDKDDRYGHPMERILYMAGLVNKADRVLEDDEVDGVKCFGVEISARKYGGTPDTTKHRIWFDMETKLPIRMEDVQTEDKYWQNDGTKKSVRVLDRFQWNPALPADTFMPKIPKGFKLLNSNSR